jgi:choline dehydrogenase-like flavoprotein
VHCGFCQWFGCEVNAKSSTLASLIPVAERTGRCEIRAESYVRKIEVNRNGRVSGAIYFDRDRREIFQRARAVVVCANGAETPRLLLMSKSARFPHGLANSNGMVGKNLMFDLGALCTGLFEHPLNEYKSVQVTRVLQDFYDSDARRGFFGGGGIDARFGQSPAMFALNGLPPDVPQWGVDWKKAVAHYFPRMMRLAAHVTSLAVERNSISLDPQVKDEWGLSAIRVTFKNHPDDLKAARFLLDRENDLMDAAGAVKKWSRPVEEVTSSVHLMGTCRMGNDATTSVVDRWNRAHDVPNLFLVDGSSMVTSGRQQPTLTIQALGYRAAEHMAELAKGGQI